MSVLHLGMARASTRDKSLEMLRVSGLLHLVTLLATGTLLVSACSKPETPKVTARAARVTAISPAGIVVGVDLDVYNPNAFPLIVAAVDGTITLQNGADIGTGHSEPKSSIGAHQSAALTSELSMNWSNLAALAPFALSPAPIAYTFRGVAKLGAERLNVAVPFTIAGQLSRDQIMKLGLRGLGQ